MVDNCITDRRVGKIEIPKNVLADTSNDDLRKIFELLGIVTHIENNFTTDALIYWFSNPEIDKVSMGEIVPEYIKIVDVIKLCDSLGVTKLFYLERVKDDEN